MLIAINYSNQRYRKQQKYNTYTAYRYGKVDKVIEYSPTDLDQEFKTENSTLLSIKRGGGLWLWKPYIILKTLTEMNDDDVLIYADSGSYYCSDVHSLVETLNREKNDILAFQIPLMEFQWTKKETFDFLGQTDFSRNQFLSGYLLLKKSTFTLNFVKEWLTCMKNPVCSSPEDNSIQVFDNFIAHREDQSVLSLLCYKYSIIGHRDPSEFGDYPWLYRYKGYAWRNIDYKNSLYPRIFANERSQNPKIYKIKLMLKDFLNSIGLYRPLFDKCPQRH